MDDWIKSGTLWVWMTAGALALSLVLVFGVLWLTAARGLAYFWPAQVIQTTFVEKDGSKIVWTVDRKEATVHARAVEVSDFTGEGVDVTEGLKPGDIVVSAGTQFMTENLKVKLPDIIGQVTADLLK